MSAAGEKFHRSDISQSLVVHELPTLNGMVNLQKLRGPSPRRLLSKSVVSPPLYEGVEQGQTCPTGEAFHLLENIRLASKSVKELTEIEQWISKKSTFNLV